MTNETVTEQLKVLREIGGYYVASDFGLLEIYGADASRFLQAQTTNDVSALTPESTQRSCLLDRKAHIQACFDLFRRHDSYKIVAEKAEIPAILDHLDQYKFNEKVEILELTRSGRFLAVEGPRALSVVSSLMEGTARPELLDHCLCDLKLKQPKGVSVHVLRKSLTGERGLFLFVPLSEFDAVYNSLKKACEVAGLVELSAEALDTARIELGHLKAGVDYSGENFLPETGLDQSTVSYTKGCFLGQEVLARVKSQGAPTRGVMGLTFDGKIDKPFRSSTSVHNEKDLEIATITSSCYSPTLQKTIAIAYLKRDFRTPGEKLAVKIDSAPYSVTVTTLPFVQPESPIERARRLFDRALDFYSKEREASESAPSVKLLKECLELAPDFEDAYEALGVILNKCGKTDEAITLMKRLAELNADSVMAHSNLSVFYLEKGEIEAAEEEKAISMSIRMKLAAREASNELKNKEEARQRQEEAKARMEMFRQVLEIDNEDLLANYGLGSCYVALEQFDEAIPFLKKAILLKPSHTVAYLSLGEALEGLKQSSEAASAYREGIAVAAKRGDMTPLKEMQQRLAKLESSRVNN